jgi:hypothetical protein
MENKAVRCNQPRSVNNMYHLLGDRNTLRDSLKQYLNYHNIHASEAQMDVVEAKCIKAYQQDNYWPFMYDLPNQFIKEPKIKTKTIKPKKERKRKIEHEITIVDKNYNEKVFAVRSLLVHYFAAEFNVPLTTACSWVKNGLKKQGTIHKRSGFIFIKKNRI